MVLVVIEIYYCDKSSESKSIHDEKYGEFTTARIIGINA
jgi:hypothetical protein